MYRKRPQKAAVECAVDLGQKPILCEVHHVNLWRWIRIQT